MPSLAGVRDGDTFQMSLDFKRLNNQAQKIFDVMSDGKWRTLSQIAADTYFPEASVSARLRDFRKPRFGGHTVNRRRRGGGLYEYQLIIA
jgi:hypothetical protein